VSVIEKIKEDMALANKKMQEIREELTEKGKAAFGEASKELFALHPQLKAFRWTQYTPYFCDGDPCEFGVNDLQVQFKERIETNDVQGVWDYSEDDEDQWVEFTHSGESHPLFSVYTDCEEVRGMLDEETLEALFGDHVQVTVHADCVETTEYEHD
jgi:hypothetical protein